MAKSTRSLDRIIEKVAEQAAEEAIDRKLEEVAAGEADTEPTPGVIFGKPPKPAPIIDDLLQSIPSGEGYYLKLYREVSPGQFEFKLRIDDYAQWTDLESEITEIVRFHTKRDPKKWGSGKYRLLAYKDGSRGIYSKPIILNIDGGESEPPAPPPSPPSQPVPDVKQQLSEMAELLKSVKVLIGEPQNQAEISRMMAESFKAGLAAVPSPANQDKVKDIMAVLSILKESGAIGQTQKDPTSAVKDAIILLKEMGVIGQPKQESNSLRETIVLLKELGLIGQPKAEPPKEDPYAMVERVLNLINLVKSVGGEVAGEKPSLGVELVRILGPRVPDMVSRITSTVDKVADVQKLKIERSLGARPTAPAQAASAPLPAGPPPAPPAAEPETPPAPPAPSTPSSATQQLHPVIAEIHNAIESRDPSYYPKLKQLIDIYIGPHMVPALVSGQINIAVFLSTLADQLGHPYFNEPQTHEYFKEFIEAQKAEKAAPATAQTSPVIGRCNHCGAEYEYMDGLVPGEPEVCGENGCSGIIELVSSPSNKGVETGG